MSAIGLLAKFLNVKPSNFGIAGNKDKRGITTQRVSLFHAFSEDIDKLQLRKKWPEGLLMGNYVYSGRQFKIGDLKGNRFALALRLVMNTEEETIIKNMQGLLDTGFINYFGLQRFGTTNIKTHVVGKEVLNKNWKGVVELILSSQSTDRFADEAKKYYFNDSSAQIFRAFLQNYDCKEALRKIPHRCKIERYIIEGLKHGGINDFKGAFMCLPRFTRELYGHAYQSYLWNKSVSKRISKYGREPIAGDLVILTTEEADIEDDIAADEAVAGEQENVVEEEKEAQETEMKDEGEKKHRLDPSKVIILTEETKKNFKFEDVLIPLIGRDIPFPENNPITDILHEVLQEDNLTLADFHKSDQDMFLTGGYRKIIIKPDDIKWDVVKYNNENEDIQVGNYFALPEPQSVPDGKYTAIRIKFNLPKSAYATMCVRELTKASTSYHFQMKLNRISQSS